MTRPQSPPDPYGRPQRPVPHTSGDSNRGALVVALIGAAATIVAALIGLFVQLSGDVEQRASGPSLGGASPASDAPDTSVVPRSSVPPSAPAAPGGSEGTDATPAPSTPAAATTTVVTTVGLPDAFRGRWQGYAEEVDATRTDHYRVTVELEQGALREQVGSVHYAMEDSDCYGTVSLTAVGGTDQVILGESIQSGNCVTNGRITLTLRPGDTVDFAYETIKRDGTRQSVKAGLERVA